MGEKWGRKKKEQSAHVAPSPRRDNNNCAASSVEDRSLSPPQLREEEARDKWRAALMKAHQAGPLSRAADADWRSLGRGDAIIAEEALQNKGSPLC